MQAETPINSNPSAVFCRVFGVKIETHAAPTEQQIAEAELNKAKRYCEHFGIELAEGVAPTESQMKAAQEENERVTDSYKANTELFKSLVRSALEPVAPQYKSNLNPLNKPSPEVLQGIVLQVTKEIWSNK